MSRAASHDDSPTGSDAPQPGSPRAGAFVVDDPGRLHVRMVAVVARALLRAIGAHE